MSGPARPPRLALRLLRRWIPARSASGLSILGDLHEEYAEIHARRGRVAAGAWIWLRVLEIGGPYALRGVGESGRGLALDLRTTLRGLRRSPGPVVVALLSVALGVGLTTAAVGLMNAAWWAPLPYPAAERLVDVRDVHPELDCPGCRLGTSWESYDAWRRTLPEFEMLSAARRMELDLQLEDRAVSVRGAAVTASRQTMLGMRAQLGRTLTPDDERPGAPPVLVLSHGLWTDAFGAEPDVLGREVRIGSRVHTVVGVLDADARPLDRTRAWIALDPTAQTEGHRIRGLWVVGRLAEGVDLAAADARLAAVASARYAQDPELEEGWSARAVPLRPVLAASAVGVEEGAALFGTALLVLLVAGLNVAALLLARTTEREHELAVRAALGAGRVRVARAALTEGVLLASLGGALGLLAARLGANAAVSRAGAGLPGWVGFPLDARVATGALALTLLVVGIGCALPLARALDVARATRLSGGLGSGGTARRLRRHDLLIAAQVAFGVVLVSGAVSAVGSYAQMRDFDGLGYRWEGITSVPVELPEGLPPEDWPSHLVRLHDAFAAHPAVASMTSVRGYSMLPAEDGRDGATIRVDGRSELLSPSRFPRQFLAVSDGYFDVYRIPIVAGRAFADRGSEGASATAVVSRATARSMWPERTAEDVVGRSFTVALDGARQRFTVLGVSEDVTSRPTDRSRAATPRVYTRLVETAPSLYATRPDAPLANQLVLRPGSAPSQRAWRDFVAEVQPGAVVRPVAEVEAILREWIEPIRLVSHALTALAGVALALLMLGVYGTLSYRIAGSRRSLGIRTALGAPPGRLVLGLVRRLASVLGAAVLLGLVAAWVLGSAAPEGFPIGATHPALLALVAFLLLGAGAASAVSPLRRALRQDPVEALRTE